ncbi:MAG TPA: precorrin-6A reductase [Bacillota bacterium]|jgi:precorrin-6x reductase|nr:precorrin-6A reductase [Bacillota bacterium]HOB29530.1 precorrin-6A reductase [Bacillota bacterium]HPZ42138.1 precorrin-6A reductase [Bacillota bacterium]HQD53022.1 precorrin-6A reductase [Bacillota bacterium]
MKKLLLFGGTSEERGLIEALALYPVAITLCVASDYGRARWPEEDERLSVYAGRIDAKQMAELIRREGFFCTIDATHPYAVEVSANIKAAAKETKIPYLRLLREKSKTGGSMVVSSVQAAAEILGELKGAALITTGSKELAAFTAVPDFKKRLYPRVLPTVESIERCLELGFPPGHIIAMQGPFSKELNIALMRQFEIKTMVTKDGGKYGGFPEKLAAAEQLGASLIVVRRPEEQGLTQGELIQKLSKLLEGG